MAHGSAIEHDGAQAALRRAPGDGQADRAATDDDDICCLWLLWQRTSLRRHYPVRS